MSTGFLALLDDVISILDDVAALSKKAAIKTSGVAADDLAVGASTVVGSPTNRELFIVGKVALGSLVNKVILVPLALAMAAYLPIALKVMLVLGGLYLCYEGSEKIIHWLLHRKKASPQKTSDTQTPQSSTPTSEWEKVKGAILTDFVLSAEIIVIAMGEMMHASVAQQAAGLAVVSVLMTIGVYGLVAAIVRLDDIGLWLQNFHTHAAQLAGKAIISSMPAIMRALSIAGTLAMLLVGGGILSHEFLQHHLSKYLEPQTAHSITPLLSMYCGFVTGTCLLALGKFYGLIGRKKNQEPAQEF